MINSSRSIFCIQSTLIKRVDNNFWSLYSSLSVLDIDQFDFIEWRSDEEKIDPMFDENQPFDQWDSPEQCFVRMTKDHPKMVPQVEDGRDLIQISNEMIEKSE